MTIKVELSAHQQRVEQQLIASLDHYNGIEPRLVDAMRYSLLNGGKRIRPALVYMICALLKGEQGAADRAAMAIEAVHSYSLIHDDLPAMDDDELRRGKPTCHIAFDEATAILAGDALQCLAFEILSAEHESLTPAVQLEALRILSRASGAKGMVMGQAFDLAHVDKPLNLEQLKAMHADKTGALITAAVELGACVAGVTDSQQRAELRRFGDIIGLAFQVKDDLLDIEASTEVLGKPSGSDIAMNKTTSPALLGLQGAHDTLAALEAEALALLEPSGAAAESLRQLTHYIVNRDP